MATTKVERIMVELGLDSSKFSADVDKAIQKYRELDKALSTTEKTAQQAAKIQSELVKKYQYSTEELTSFLQDMTRLKEQLSQLLNVIADTISLDNLAGDATKLLDQLVKSSEIIINWQKAFSSFGTSTQGLTTALNNIKEAMNGLVEFGQANMSPYLLSFVNEMNDSKLSVDSLNTAFIHLAKTVKNDVLPELFNYSNVIDKLKLYNQSVKLENNQQIIKNRSTAENHIPAGSIKSQSPTRSKTRVASKTSAQNKTPPISKEPTRNKTPAQQKIPVESKTSTQNKTSIQNTAPTLGKTPTSNKVASAKITPNNNNIKGSENIADKARKAADYATKHALPRSSSNCGYYVNESFRKQGINVWGHGEDVAKNLIATGKFQSIAYNDKYIAQKGDVMSIPSIAGHPHGHAAIFNGEYWVSDYIQTKKRGNTAAPGDDYFAAIKAGKITPVIARMKATRESSEVVSKGLMAGAFAPVQNTGQQNFKNKNFKSEVVSKGLMAGAFAPVQNTSQQNFRNKNFTKEKAESIARVAKNIGVDPNDLAAVISFETGGTFNPNIRNPKSSATGLIQFMAGSGGKKGLYYGMTRDQFGRLSFDEQMKYVERYFKERGFDGKRKRDVADTYTAVAGYGYRKGSKAYELNRVWDSNGDEYIDKGEMVLNKKFKAHQRQYYTNISNNAQKASEMISQNQQMQASSNVIKNDNRKHVNVNIQNINVKTSSNTVSGTAVAALKEAHNYLFNQLGTSVT